MNKKQLKYFIATDTHNILRDGENKIFYFFKKLLYKIELLIIKTGE